MTEQQPTRFENYPPETPAAPFVGADPTPPPPPVLPAPSRPVEQPPRTQSRRNLISSVIGLAIGVPIMIAVGLSGSERSDAPSDEWTMDAEPPFEEPDAQGDAPADFTVGEYTVAVPTGWELTTDEDPKVVLARDANQVTVMVLDPDSDGATPVDDIAEVLRSAETGFTGKPGKPVDESTDSRPVASMSGKGEFQGRAARQFAELWLDDDGSYLLIVTVLTAAEGSPIARQALGIGSSLTAGLR